MKLTFFDSPSTLAAVIAAISGSMALILSQWFQILVEKRRVRQLIKDDLIRLDELMNQLIKEYEMIIDAFSKNPDLTEITIKSYHDELNLDVYHSIQPLRIRGSFTARYTFQIMSIYRMVEFMQQNSPINIWQEYAAEVEKNSSEEIRQLNYRKRKAMKIAITNCQIHIDSIKVYQKKIQEIAKKASIKGLCSPTVPLP